MVLNFTVIILQDRTYISVSAHFLEGLLIETRLAEWVWLANGAALIVGQQWIGQRN